MNHLLKVVLFNVLMILAIGVSAQSKEAKVTERKPEETAKKMTEKQTKDLGLSAEQQKKVYDINLKYSTELQSRKEEQVAERKSAMEKNKSLREKRDAEMKSVLTEDQYATMLKKKEERQQAAKSKHQGQKKGPKKELKEMPRK